MTIGLHGDGGDSDFVGSLTFAGTLGSILLVSKHITLVYMKGSLFISHVHEAR
jgi:hypothetical protein